MRVSIFASLGAPCGVGLTLMLLSIRGAGQGRCRETWWGQPNERGRWPL